MTKRSNPPIEDTTPQSSKKIIKTMTKKICRFPYATPACLCNKYYEKRKKEKKKRLYRKRRGFVSRFNAVLNIHKENPSERRRTWYRRLFFVYYRKILHAWKKNAVFDTYLGLDKKRSSFYLACKYSYMNISHVFFGDWNFECLFFWVEIYW